MIFSSNPLMYSLEITALNILFLLKLNSKSLITSTNLNYLKYDLEV